MTTLSKNISKKEHQHRDLSTAVEMTKGRAALPGTVVAEQEPLFITLGGPKAHDNSVEKHFQERASTQRSLHCGRDDKGEGGASRHGSCRTGAAFHHLGWAEGP